MSRRPLLSTVTKTSYTSCELQGCGGSKPIPKHSFDVFTVPRGGEGVRPEGAHVLLVVNPYSGGKRGVVVGAASAKYLEVSTARRSV